MQYFHLQMWYFRQTHHIVYAGEVPLPPTDDGIPAPSIYFDDRGEIHNVKVDNKRRIDILHTKKGCMRSGDMHPNEQCDFVFSGKVKIWTLAKNGSTTTTTYGKHELIKIPRGE